jgi:cell division protein ZapA
MAQVSVTINGRHYRMACEDGQEEHLLGLARNLDGRITQLRANFGEIGDMRLTVMAALMIADEFSETNRQLRTLEDELVRLREVGAAAGDRVEATENAIAAALNNAAERIENLTRSLNPGRTSGAHSLPIG